MPAANHVHKYRRLKFKTGKVYYDCVWCPHLLPLSRMEGKLSICWGCEEPFEITKKTLKYQMKPKCEICTSSSKEKEDLVGRLEKRLDDANS